MVADGHIRPRVVDAGQQCVRWGCWQLSLAEDADGQRRRVQRHAEAEVTSLQAAPHRVASSQRLSTAEGRPGEAGLQLGTDCGMAMARRSPTAPLLKCMSVCRECGCMSVMQCAWTEGVGGEGRQRGEPAPAQHRWWSLPGSTRRGVDGRADWAWEQSAGTGQRGEVQRGERSRGPRGAWPQVQGRGRCSGSGGCEWRCGCGSAGHRRTVEVQRWSATPTGAPASVLHVSH